MKPLRDALVEYVAVRRAFGTQLRALPWPSVSLSRCSNTKEPNSSPRTSRSAGLGYQTESSELPGRDV